MQKILCDPLDKGPLRRDGDILLTRYGRKYLIRSGVYDLRLLTQSVGPAAVAWEEGQQDFERRSNRSVEEDLEDYAAQKRGVEDVYAAIPLLGRCLDVGGMDGRLRAFLGPDQEYLAIDPFVRIATHEVSEAFKRIYPFIVEPMNFCNALAEHLPFVADSFDTVHMRSCLDHFLNPELALREAYRVLRADGQLIVGLTVTGGRPETLGPDLGGRAKHTVKAVLAKLGFDRFHDHHIWHPTYEQLCQLIVGSGFSIKLTHWQQSERDRVCYLKAEKAF